MFTRGCQMSLDNPIERSAIQPIQVKYNEVFVERDKNLKDKLDNFDENTNFRITHDDVAHLFSIKVYEKGIGGMFQSLGDRIKDFFNLHVHTLARDKAIKQIFDAQVPTTTEINKLLTLDGKISRAAGTITLSQKLAALCKTSEQIKDLDTEALVDPDAEVNRIDEWDDGEKGAKLIKDALDLSSDIEQHIDKLTPQEQQQFAQFKKMFISRATHYVNFVMKEAADKAKNYNLDRREAVAAFVADQKACQKLISQFKDVSGFNRSRQEFSAKNPKVKEYPQDLRYPKELYEMDRDSLAILVEIGKKLQDKLFFSSKSEPVTDELAESFKKSLDSVKELASENEIAAYSDATEGLKEAMNKATSSDELLEAYTKAYKVYSNPSKFGNIPTTAFIETLQTASSRIYTKRHAEIGKGLREDPDNTRSALLKPYVDDLTRLGNKTTAVLKESPEYSDTKIAFSNKDDALKFRAQNKTHALLSLTSDIVSYNLTIANQAPEKVQHEAYSKVKNSFKDYFSDFNKNVNIRLPDWAKRIDTTKSADIKSEKEIMEKLQDELNVQIGNKETPEAAKVVFREALTSFKPIVNHGMNAAVDEMPERYKEMIKGEANRTPDWLPVTPDKIRANLNSTFVA